MINTDPDQLVGRPEGVPYRWELGPHQAQSSARRAFGSSSSAPRVDAVADSTVAGLCTAAFAEARESAAAVEAVDSTVAAARESAAAAPAGVAVGTKVAVPDTMLWSRDHASVSHERR